mgnify:CR=1 FL=1
MVGTAAVGYGSVALVGITGFPGAMMHFMTAIVVTIVARPAMYNGIRHFVFVLPPLWSAIAILFASMPVGANAFMFAAKYDRVVGSVSAAIGITTALSIVSVFAVLYAITLLGL